MRRTYRSKKDDGSLDRKTLISKFDARSSAFDNFYIHNIKLNNKELFSSACSNQINVASKKIRKRKYVKRIVNDASQREVPHSADSGTQSVLLTPDKSIHVNKAPDPFDLLLRSTPTFTKSPMLIKKSREKPKIKKKTKHNSSIVDCTDWNNENATTKVNSLSHSTSDVKSHRLMVEVEGAGDPKCHDESISRIVRIMPLLNDDNKDEHRLTATYRNSPGTGNSPLCSTPFQLKYRCKSIFNISPISNSFNESSKVVMKTLNRSSSWDEEENKSQCESSVQIQSSLVANATNREGIQSKSKDPINGQASFVSQKQARLESKQLNTLSTSELEPCYGFAKVALIDNINTNTDHIHNYLETHTNNISVLNKSHQVSSEFKNKKFCKFEDEGLRCSSDCLLSDSSLPVEKVNKNEKCASKNRCTSGNKDYRDSNVLTSPETACPCNKINYIQCKSNSCLLNDNNYLCNPNLVVALEKMNDSMFYKYYKKYKSTESIRHQSKVFKDLTNLEQRDNLIELSNVSYNTDCSNNLEEKENPIEISNASYNTDCGNIMEEKENPIELSNASYNTDCGNIMEEKENPIELSNASYNTDCGNIMEEKENPIELSNASYNTDCGNIMEEKENPIELSNASYNTDCSNNLEEKENPIELSNASYITDCGNNLEEKENLIELSNVSYNRDCGNFYSMVYFSPENTSLGFKQIRETNETHKEDAGISYVTTRRRHEIVNNSIIISPNNSYGDVSTSSNYIIELTESEKSNVASMQECAERGIVPTSNDSAADSIVSKHEDTLLRDHIPDSKGSISDIESNSTRKRDDTKLTDCDTLSRPKVAIVLQPGKKWERSLSIYKRMTTIADTNHSLLDYEQMERKGRKYRQSVIDTMQMQKSFCSLHNEPINGRRSTFICKPSRSTIKLVKENSSSRASLCPTTAYEDLKGFLSDDCDDTIVDLSKLSIGESVHEVTVVEKFHEASRIATARDYVLRRCNQTEPLPFDECYPDTALKNCHKIGEGVYGEVFLWRARDGEARVLKVIPIAGDIKVNGEPQKGYHEIISEIVIAMELSALRAPIPDIEKRLDEGKELNDLDLHSVENATDIFNEVVAARCVVGAYPARLLELWELYDECRGSDNDTPAALPAHQHYLVLELRNAGRDLESYSFTAADQAYAVLLQLAFGLAVAEEALQFEHRDLHWGNVLVAPSDQQFATFLVRGRLHRVRRRGAAAVVIDYSLSRVSLRGAALYADLADDDSLFEAVGDRQFDVYRLMRDRLGNEWKNFEPYTNVLWLHYVADKMVTALRYERPDTKLHRHYLGRLRALRRALLAHASAADFVLAHAHAHAHAAL